MCLGGWVEDYGVNVEVTEEMESIKDHGCYCIILTVQHLADAFIQSDSKTPDRRKCRHYIRRA